MGTIEARFLECAVATHWLPHTPVQIFFCLVLVLKKVWCSLSSLSIQTGVLGVTFCKTLFLSKFPIKLPNDSNYSTHVFYKGRLQKKVP